jgi:hypothetical protein
MSLTAMKRSIPRTQFTRKIQPYNDETEEIHPDSSRKKQNSCPQKRNIDPISIMVGNPAPDVA